MAAGRRRRLAARRLAGRLLPGSAVSRLDRLLFTLRHGRIRAIHRLFGALGFNIVRKADYYSTLPVLGEIERTRARWDRPERASPASTSTSPR